MSVLSGLTLLAGVLAFLCALWVEWVVSRQYAGQASRTGLIVAGLVGVFTALLAFRVTASPVHASMALAAGTALCVAVNTDLRFGRLADLTSLIIGLAALRTAPSLSPGLTYIEMVIAAALAVGILTLAGLYGRWRQGQMGLGSGDIILVGALALWCPPVTAALGVALGAAMTLLAALAFRARANTRLPFGPGLVAGFIIAFALDKLT